jgi:hypothetical protein
MPDVGLSEGDKNNVELKSKYPMWWAFEVVENTLN